MKESICGGCINANEYCQHVGKLKGMVVTSKLEIFPKCTIAPTGKCFGTTSVSEGQVTHSTTFIVCKIVTDVLLMVKLMITIIM
jgi:hypothetical protein